MYDEKPQNKLLKLISIFLTEYLGWIVVILVIVAWIFYPDLLETYGQLLLFWIPAIVIILSLFIILSKYAFRFKRDEAQGITQYDLIIFKSDFYFSEIIIYSGTLAILVVAYVFGGVTAFDLIQAIIFFIFASWLKQIFYRKILK
ncbi:MAG: hypothetical protein NT116_06165 [Candidatus Parcubacteria bacterium]|nr:hypothetical protein [Candidatus Parcubacteria bacterium]